MTLADLVPDVQGRLDEISDGGFIFWNLQNEVLPSLVDAMYEAALLTGVVQAVNIPVTLAANQTYFSLQNNVAIGVPAGVIAALRMRFPYPVRKTSLKGLGDIIPGWQTAARAQVLRAWFPLGISSFGIFPQLSVESQVTMDFIVSPVTVPRPYPQTVTLPFEEQFTSAFAEYAAASLRMKELGIDADEAEPTMNAYLTKMRDLSLYQGRLDSLVFTRSSGANAQVNRREVV